MFEAIHWEDPQKRDFLTPMLQGLEASLKGREYLLGNDFTVADVAVGSFLIWSKGLKKDKVCPHVQLLKRKCRSPYSNFTEQALLVVHQVCRACHNVTQSKWSTIYMSHWQMHVDMIVRLGCPLASNQACSTTSSMLTPSLAAHAHSIDRPFAACLLKIHMLVQLDYSSYPGITDYHKRLSARPAAKELFGWALN